MTSPLLNIHDSSLEIRDVVGDNNEVYLAKIALSFNDLNPEIKEIVEKGLTKIMRENLIHEIPVARQTLAIEGVSDGLALYHQITELEEALTEKELEDMIDMYCMACQVTKRPTSSNEFFASLIHSGKLKLRDFTFLQSLLWKVGRKDLFKMWVEKAQELQDIHKNDTPPLRISYLDAPSLTPIEGYMYIKFHVKVDLLDIGSERLRKLQTELAQFLGVPQQYIAVMGVEPDESAWVTVIMPAVACRALKANFDNGAIHNFLKSLDIDKVGFFPDPGEGVDEGCVSKAADPDHTMVETTSKDEGDGTRSSAPVFDKAKVPNYFEGDEYFFGYPRRGSALIINNMHFFDMKSRPSSKHDVEMLRKVFAELGFYVKIYQDLTADQMREVLQKEAKEDHSEEDCFACAVLTHGGEMSADKDRKVDVLLGTDGTAVPVPTEDLLNILSDENCPSLEYKPRLFFIEAGRGEKLDEGKEVGVTEDKKTEELGATAGDVPDKDDLPCGGDEADVSSLSLSRDFLVAYSTKPGHVSFSRDTGSWFVHSLYEAFKQTRGHDSLNLLKDVLTRAADIQAKEFESKSRDPRLQGKKTVSHVTHSLTKDVIFRRKEGTAAGSEPL